MIKNNILRTINFALAILILTTANATFTQAQVPPAIPPAPRVVPGETNYQKCLNRALLSRETSAKIAYQTFNASVEPQRAALAEAAKPFSGWLAWLNVFRRETVQNFERLNAEYVEAMEKASPARDESIDKSNSKFTVDQQYCLAHQNATYEWTPEDQKALDQLIPPRVRGNGKGEMPK